MKSLIAVMSLLLYASALEAGHYAYVSNAGGPNQIGIIDLDTNTVLGAIQLDNNPHQLSLNIPRGLLYVGSNNFTLPTRPGGIWVIKLSSHGLYDTIPMTSEYSPWLVSNSTGTLVYASNSTHVPPAPGVNKMVVIDAYSDAPIASFDAFFQLMILNPAGTRLYGSSNALYVYDTSTYALVTSAPLPAGGTRTTSLLLSKDGKSAWVLYQVEGGAHVNYLARFDFTTNLFVGAPIPLPDDRDGYDVVGIPSGACFNADESKLYYGMLRIQALDVQGTLKVFDMTSQTVVASIPVPAPGIPSGGAGGGIYGNYFYEMNGYVSADVTGSISVIDLATNTVVKTLDGFRDPRSIVFYPPEGGGPDPYCPSLNTMTKPDSIYTVDAAQGLVTDNTTGLMWKRCSEGQNGITCTDSATAMTWSQALIAADTSEFAGYSDWRLPNVKELETLVETACYGPAINKNAFTATVSAPYWSSTTNTEYVEKAWTVLFDGSGNINWPYWKAYDPGYVRLVRGGTAGAVFDRMSPPGDTNGDHAVTVQDVFYLINSLFAGGPGSVGLADVNGDHAVTVADVFYLINFLFAGGPPPIF